MASKIEYKGKRPEVGEKVFLAEGSKLIGDVKIGEDSSVFYNAVLRGDIAPIVVGLICQRYLPKLTKRLVPYLPAFSTLMITLVVVIVVSHNASKLLVGGLLVVLVVMLHNLLGLTVGYLVGRALRLARPKCVALSVEVGMQNSGLASSLAVLHFAAYPLATIPGAVFSVWHNISGAMAARFYSRGQ